MVERELENKMRFTWPVYQVINSTPAYRCSHKQQLIWTGRGRCSHDFPKSKGVSQRLVRTICGTLSMTALKSSRHGISSRHDKGKLPLPTYRAYPASPSAAKVPGMTAEFRRGLRDVAEEGTTTLCKWQCQRSLKAVTGRSPDLTHRRSSSYRYARRGSLISEVRDGLPFMARILTGSWRC
jgi:hypothetical protein